MRVVRAEQPHLFAVAGDQLAQPLLVGPRRLPSAALSSWKKRSPGGQAGGVATSSWWK